MAYINHLQQQRKTPLTASAVGGPEEGDVLAADGEDPTALLSRVFKDTLARNVEGYRRNPVPTRSNLDALEAARSEGFIADDPMAMRGRRAQQADKLAIEEARNIGRLGVAETSAGARRYEADARRDVAGTNAEARTGGARVQGLMRQLEELRGQRGALKPAVPEQPGTGLRGWLGIGSPARPGAPNDQDRIDYIDTQSQALERQLGNEPQEFGWDEVEAYAAETGESPENVETMLRARGHAVYR